jgi:hypothetical protein
MRAQMEKQDTEHRFEYLFTNTALCHGWSSSCLPRDLCHHFRVEDLDLLWVQKL